MNISEFHKKIEIGEAYRLCDEVYGRVVGFDENSAKFNNEHSVVYFATPHGNVIRTGRAHIDKITSLKDLETLYQYENKAIEAGVKLYDKSLDNIDYKKYDKQNVLEFAKLINDVEEEFAAIPGWFPLEVQLEITNDCTLKCTMCYNGVRAKDLKFEENLKACEALKMTKEQEEKFHTLVNTCLENGAKFFTITGGEPLLYPDLVCDLVKKIKEKGCYASINTNSTLITEKIAKQLKDAGLNSALTSIHGSTEDVHRKIVCTPNVHKRTLSGIKNLIQNGIHVVPNFVASHTNVSDMYETAMMLYNLGLKRQAFSIFIPTPGVEHHKHLTMTKEDYELYFNTLQRLNDNYSDLSATATLPVPPCLAQGLVDAKVLEKFEHRTCPSGRQFMVVNVDGNVSPCIQRSFDEKYGTNLLDNPKTILNSMKDWKKLSNTPQKCVDCAAKSYCNPCNMNILVNNDNLNSSSIPYPDFAPLKNDEAQNLAKKYTIEISAEDDDLNKVYTLQENILIRQEEDEFITVINPSIQGYTVLANITCKDLKGHFKFINKYLYRLLKAMNAIKLSDSEEYAVIEGKTVPKYKILTEFIGKDFADKNLVYTLRTDTAGRFFCLANTDEENLAYENAKKVYKMLLKH